MITERTLRRWRRDSLMKVNNPVKITSKNGDAIDVSSIMEGELHERILRLTQDLLDRRLVERS